MFANIVSRYWWMTLLRGIIWVLLGIVIFSQPGLSLLMLTLLFGGFVFADGIVNVANAVKGRDDQENWWVLLLVGLAGIGIGILTFMNPQVTAASLQFFIAIWAIATGLLEVLAAIRLRKEIAGEFWLVLAGLVSIAFGVLLVARPLAGALTVAWLIASYAVVFGIVLIALAFRVRGFVGQVSKIARA